MFFFRRRRTALDNALIFAGITTEAAVLVLLLSRRIYKSLPVFACYVAWSIVNDIGVFLLMQRFPGDAGRIYLVSAIVDAVFMFCILIEICISVLKPIRSSLPRWFPFAVGSLVACLCGVVWFFAKPSGHSGAPVSQLIDHMQLTTASVRVLFFIALAALSQVLSLGWRDRELQIATGFGIYSFASLFVELVHQNPALRASAIMPEYHVLELIASLSYILSMLYWVFSFAQVEAERREFTPQMQNFLLAVAGNARATRMAITDAPKPDSDRRSRR